jgi:hypothetical protein
LACAQSIVPVEEVSFFIELLPKLFTPLCQDPQDGWTFDRNYFAADLLFREKIGVLRYFPPNQERCVLFNFLFIFFFFFDPEYLSFGCNFRFFFFSSLQFLYGVGVFFASFFISSMSRVFFST